MRVQRVCDRGIQLRESQQKRLALKYPLHFMPFHQIMGHHEIEQFDRILSVTVRRDQ